MCVVMRCYWTDQTGSNRRSSCALNWAGNYRPYADTGEKQQMILCARTCLHNGTDAAESCADRSRTQKQKLFRGLRRLVAQGCQRVDAALLLLLQAQPAGAGDRAVPKNSQRRQWYWTNLGIWAAQYAGAASHWT